MKEILLDTNAYAAFKRGDPEAIGILRLVERISISVVVLGELLSGFATGQREAVNRRELSAFLDSPRARILAVDDETAGRYASIYAGLKRRGKPIPTNDLWIAATALQYGAAVFTYDRHFASVDGLAVVSRVTDILP